MDLFTFDISTSISASFSGQKRYTGVQEEVLPSYMLKNHVIKCKKIKKAAKTLPKQIKRQLLQVQLKPIQINSVVQPLECYRFDSSVFSSYTSLWLKSTKVNQNGMEITPLPSSFSTKILQIEAEAVNDSSLPLIASQRESMQRAAIDRFILDNFADSKTALFSFHSVTADFNLKGLGISFCGFSNSLLSLLGLDNDKASLAQVQQLLSPHFLPSFSCCKFISVDGFELLFEALSETMYFEYPLHISRFFGDLKERVFFTRYIIDSEHSASINRASFPISEQQLVYQTSSRAFIEKYYLIEHQLKQQALRFNKEADDQQQINVISADPQLTELHNDSFKENKSYSIRSNIINESTSQGSGQYFQETNEFNKYFATDASDYLLNNNFSEIDCFSLDSN